MDNLWHVIARLGTELHPDRVTAIACHIAALESAGHLALAKPAFGPNMDKELLVQFEAAWLNTKNVQPGEVAAALRGASAAARLNASLSSVELVWTGPSSGLVPVRHTEQALCEVIQSAKYRVFIVSFVAYEVASVIKSLQDATFRQVQIDMLLESSVSRGGKVTVDSVATLKDSVPQANIYVWGPYSRGADAGASLGAVHAKCAVSDGKLAFVTSANLSAAAMEKNMEIGVLVKGGHLPDGLHRHLEALIQTEIVKLA